MHMVRDFESLTHFFNQGTVRVILTGLKILIQIAAVLRNLVGVVKRQILPPITSAVFAKLNRKISLRNSAKMTSTHFINSFQ